MVVGFFQTSHSRRFGALTSPTVAASSPLMNTNEGLMEAATQQKVQPPIKVKYCMYARKSSEQDERQALSIESQIKEMSRIAEREKLDIVEIRQESHSAKNSGERPVFNGILESIRSGIFNGIITWAPDRLSRNAGDLGKLVDMMDRGQLVEVRTFGQKFSNTPNEKFLLMILCSQAKLENDNKGVNVMRGLRARVETGLWPGKAPLGYLNQMLRDKKCEVAVDKQREPVLKMIFRKAGGGWSGRKIYHWLKDERKFRTRGDKPLTLSGIYRVLTSPFYYGMFEFPRKSGNWYQGKHVPLISEDLFRKVQLQLKREETRRGASEFAFTKLISCGLCGSHIIAEQKFVKRKDGTTTRCVYYGCGRSKDRNCKNQYIKEDDFMTKIADTIDNIKFNELGVVMQCEHEIARLKNLSVVLGKEDAISLDPEKIDPKSYAKHLLKNGSASEKRILLSNLRSILIYKNRTVEVAHE